MREYDVIPYSDVAIYSPSPGTYYEIEPGQTPEESGSGTPFFYDTGERVSGQDVLDPGTTSGPLPDPGWFTREVVDPTYSNPATTPAYLTEEAEQPAISVSSGVFIGGRLGAFRFGGTAPMGAIRHAILPEFRFVDWNQGQVPGSGGGGQHYLSER